MMNITIIHILAFSLMLSPSQAFDSFVENKENSALQGIGSDMRNLRITIKPSKKALIGLEDVKTYTEDLIAEGIQPKSVLLVLDVDGTLTNFTDPNESPDLKSITARGESVSFVKNMVNKGVNVVISSAWHSFEETLERLRNLGLEEILQIPSTQPHTKNDDYILFDDINTKSCYLGLVASVGYSSNISHYYQKAFAYKLVYPDLSEHTITHVIFGDDNSQIVRDFERDFSTLKDQKGLFNSAKVKLFTLCKARGEAYLK